jgi:hypothetical protein
LQRGQTAADGGRTKGFRVWLAACGSWQPRGPRDQPPEAVALEPAEEAVLSARQAACYVKAFNRAARARGLRVCAVALPVVVRYEGDLRPGQKFAVNPCSSRADGAKRRPPDRVGGKAGVAPSADPTLCLLE